MSPQDYSEDELVERPTVALLESLGYEVVNGYREVAATGELGRTDQSQVVLRGRLEPKLAQLNPEVGPAAIEFAIAELMQDRSTLDRTRANQAVFKLIRDGVKLTVVGEDGERSTETVRLIDWNDPSANDFLVVNQFWVTGPMHRRRCDIVCFVNGIPLVLLELKASHRSVEQAYRQNLTDYRDAVPQLFTPNAFVILSTGSETKVGSTFAPWERFGDWKRVDQESEAGVISLETAIRGLCEPAHLLDSVENFVAYLERPGGLTKVLAQNHQLLGVNAAIRALRDPATRDGRLGVFWHTQGSGKSLSMLFFTQKVLRREPGNWTFVMVTDRAELDDQLYDEFKDAGVVEGHLQADSSAHLRRLLGENHRYVFTLIHKFRPARGEEMPVCSERDDVIVITDEAHRSQYSRLALNMRQALPNADFLGFTGTPLIRAEAERTREVFGDYISTYNFRDSIADGATVPLFYENRIPELQIINERFDEELTGILEQAELDETQEQALSRRFATEYQLITRPERLRRIAADLVRHFVGRGFLGKAMFVAIDKATAVRMHDLVAEEWAKHLDELRERAARLPELERVGVDEQIRFMEDTETAVVVSQSQNEIAEMREAGLDIEPHRRKMLDEDLDERFKDAADPFRLVFVCAMWMTGFDVPSCSTIYLDRPMRNHSLMQTIARANRVFPEKENGLIVDYVGVFRRLEEALAIYAAAREGDDAELEVIRDKAALVEELEEEIGELREFCERWDVDLEALARASGFEFIALRDASVEALLIDDVTRRAYLERSARVRRLFAAILPDPAANAHVRIVGVARNLAETIRGLDPAPDLSGVAGSVQELLDRSVGAEEYVIRAAADGADADSLIDLNEIDFEALVARAAGKRRTEAQRLSGRLRAQVERAVERNPTRHDLVVRFRELIEEYNAGSLNVDELLRRLQELSRGLSEEEERTVREGLSEPELAVFDLLTKPDPELTDDERSEVKRIARKLMGQIQDRLVLDWRKRAETRESARVLVKDVLEDLPEAYDPETWERKTGIVFDHIFAAFYDDGGSVYGDVASVTPPVERDTVDAEAGPVDVDAVSATVLEKIRSDRHFAELVAEQLRGDGAFFAATTDELIAGDEGFAVEFKSTARWNLREEAKDKRIEDAIVKTVAGFLNADGGTLLIGVSDDRQVLGLGSDLPLVKPQSADGLVNWLTTHLIGAIGHTAAMSTRVRIDAIAGREVCRVDVARSSRPVMASMSDRREVFWVRMNNSTRELPEIEWDAYRRDRWRPS
ncbi:HsdR family type I site-specific deoxyribonuclease [Thermoleophilia bacterium SCSIO 60948]|nr:HsdR family type I site-specific deoxyribonuclease [Thermoleophilia bacterium SCSIO 60948]